MHTAIICDGDLLNTKDQCWEVDRAVAKATLFNEELRLIFFTNADVGLYQLLETYLITKTPFSPTCIKIIDIKSARWQKEIDGI